jgi:hypothetical protein
MSFYYEQTRFLRPMLIKNYYSFKKHRQGQNSEFLQNSLGFFAKKTV